MSISPPVTLTSAIIAEVEGAADFIGLPIILQNESADGGYQYFSVYDPKDLSEEDSENGARWALSRDPNGWTVADNGRFDCLSITAPYSVKTYASLIAALESIHREAFAA